MQVEELSKPFFRCCRVIVSFLNCPILAILVLQQTKLPMFCHCNTNRCVTRVTLILGCIAAVCSILCVNPWHLDLSWPKRESTFKHFMSRTSHAFSPFLIRRVHTFSRVHTCTLSHSLTVTLTLTHLHHSKLRHFRTCTHSHILSTTFSRVRTFAFSHVHFACTHTDTCTLLLTRAHSCSLLLIDSHSCSLLFALAHLHTLPHVHTRSTQVTHCTHSQVSHAFHSVPIWFCS